MDAELAPTYRAARRQYELGRLLVAVRSAVIVAAVVGVIAGVLFGREALAWLPVTVVAVVVTEWRGTVVMQSARRGLLAGVGSMLLPLSVLRPCCGIDAKAMGEATCCTMPSACWAAGAMVGLFMALLMPQAPEGKRTESAIGMILGVTAGAVTRCSMLFLGEAVGLLGGIMAGIAAASLARVWLDRRAAQSQ